MNAKKEIRKYIRPGFFSLYIALAGAVVLLLDPDVDSFGSFGVMLMMFALYKLVFFDLLVILRASKSIKQLEREGLLEKAAQELTAENKTVYGKNKAVVTENFFFARKRGTAVCSSRIVYMYKRVNIVRLMFIPIFRMEALSVFTPATGYVAYMKVGKDKQDIAVQIADKLIRHNPNMMIGFSAENNKAYAQIKKKYKRFLKEEKSTCR